MYDVGIFLGFLFDGIFIAKYKDLNFHVLSICVAPCNACACIDSQTWRIH